MTLAKIAKAGKEILGFGTRNLLGALGDLCERIFSVRSLGMPE
jgi:hypothetical protein